MNPQESENSYSLVEHIEAILFWKGDPMSIPALSKITSASKEEVKEGLQLLKEKLSGRGVVLIEHDGEFTLGTNPKSALLIETVRTEELSKDLGKASLETLAIILYQGPIRRTEIDYIRGVNSNFILRNLLIRGLIERKADETNSRSSVYNPSMELLRFLGITQVSELEDFDKVREAIQEFKSADEDSPKEASDETSVKEVSDDSASIEVEEHNTSNSHNSYDNTQSQEEPRIDQD